MIIMKQSFIIYILVLAAAFLTACSHTASVDIKGDIAGGREVTLRLVCYSTQGVKSEVLATPGGHFDYKLTVPSGKNPVFIEVYTNDYKPLGMAMATPGEELRMNIDPLKGIAAFSFSGGGDAASDYAARLDSWLSTVKTIDNRSVADFVRANSDSPLAYAVLSILYDSYDDPATARSLFEALEDDARPDYYAAAYAALTGEKENPAKLKPITLLCHADTLTDINPADRRATFVAYTTGDNSAETDSIVSELHRLGQTSKAKNTLVLEHNVAQDTVSWRRAVKQYVRTLNNEVRRSIRDNGPLPENSPRIERINWISVWSGPDVTAPGVAEYNVRRLPWFIVADSTATITYNGPDMDKAIERFDKIK